MSKTAKIIIFSIISFVIVASAIFIPLLTAKCTVTLDYCVSEGSSYNRILGFTGGTDIITTDEVHKFTAYSPIKPNFENYVFQGWYKDAGYTVAWINGDKVTSDLTLYAKWSD